MIDISAMQAFHTEDDIRSLAGLVLEKGFIAAHALPHFVPLLRSLIPVGGATFVGGPVGFPSGGHTTMIKLAEARSLVGHDDQSWTVEVWRPLLRPKRDQGRRRNYRTHSAKGNSRSLASDG
jgi:hypothetical protein